MAIMRVQKRSCKCKFISQSVIVRPIRYRMVDVRGFCKEMGVGLEKEGGCKCESIIYRMVDERGFCKETMMRVGWEKGEGGCQSEIIV